MTSEEIRLKEKFDEVLNGINPKYYVVGYVINDKKEMEIFSVAVHTEEARDKNVGKLVNAKIYELKEVL